MSPVQSPENFQMEVDQVGGDAGSALLMLSQMANKQQSRPANQQSTGMQDKSMSTESSSTHTSAATSPTESTAAPPRRLNVYALVMHIKGLEERIKQLEGSVQMLNAHMRHGRSELVSPIMMTSPNLTSPKVNVPPTLTSIKFNHPKPNSPSVSPINAAQLPQIGRPPAPCPPPHFMHPNNQGVQTHQNPSMSMQNLPSPPTAGMWPSQGMVLKDATVKDVQRNVLDKICTPVLEHCYDPDKPKLVELVDELEKHHFYHIDRRVLMSAVRRWFRKRREEMGARIFMLCKNPEYIQVEEEQVRDFLINLRKDNDLIDRIRTRVGLEVKDDQQAREFCLEKIDSFFRRKISHSTP